MTLLLLFLKLLYVVITVTYMITNWTKNQSNQWRGYILFKADELAKQQSNEPENQTWLQYIASYIY